MVSSRASSASASASVPERYPQEAASSAVISDVPMPRHSSCQCGLFPKRKLKRGCLEQHPHKSELKSVLKSVSLAFSSWSGCLALRSYALPGSLAISLGASSSCTGSCTRSDGTRYCARGAMKQLCCGICRLCPWHCRQCVLAIFADMDQQRGFD